MKLGEVCFLTDDVERLSRFYKALLGITGDCGDSVHQTLIAEETMLTIYNDGLRHGNDNTNMCVAFTVDDVDAECARLKALGARIISEPKTQPWGSRNLSFYDPDNNMVFLRQLAK